jgi:hypothetical protein
LDEAGREDPPVGLGEQDGDAPTKRGEVITVGVRASFDGVFCV